jgi:AcrR family transcriptional regulator
MPTETAPHHVPEPVPQRLLHAARDLFLSDDYHRVSTRQVAEKAQVNVSMIRYYFGSKQGLYEAMIEANLSPLLAAMEQTQPFIPPQGIADFFSLYYQSMQSKPDFPRLILKVLALKQGPGRRFIYQLLERGKAQGSEKVAALKALGLAPTHLNPDVVRMAFVSLALMPMLIKDIFDEQGSTLDEKFLSELAAFNGQLFAGVFHHHEISKK